MGTRLAERFQAAHGGPIDVDGQKVHMMFELPPLDKPGQLEISLTAAADRPEGLRLKARHGDIEVDGKILTDVVLWSDTAPPEVVVQLRPRDAGESMSVRVWNVWRDEAQTMQAWIGDSGIVVAYDAANQITLRCSDGFDKPTFDDLVVGLNLPT